MTTHTTTTHVGLSETDRRYYREARRLGWTARSAYEYVAARRVIRAADQVGIFTWGLEWDPDLARDPDYANTAYALVVYRWPEPSNAWRTDDHEVIGSLGGVAEREDQDQDPYVVVEVANILSEWLAEQHEQAEREAGDDPQHWTNERLADVLESTWLDGYCDQRVLDQVSTRLRLSGRG